MASHRSSKRLKRTNTNECQVPKISKNENVIDTNKEKSPLVVFAHGAGAPSTSDWMIRWKAMLKEALDAVEVVTFDYPYLSGGKRRAPPKAEKLVEYHLKIVKDSTEKYPGHPLILAGKSMGSRVSCMVANAREDLDVSAIICLGYPLKDVKGKEIDQLREAIEIDNEYEKIYKKREQNYKEIIQRLEADKKRLQSEQQQLKEQLRKYGDDSTSNDSLMLELPLQEVSGTEENLAEDESSESFEDSDTDDMTEGTKGALRDEILLQLTAQTIFVQGSKDGLCPLDKLETTRKKMKCKNELHVIEGGDHSFKIGKKFLDSTGITQDEAESNAVKAIAEFVSQAINA